MKKQILVPIDLSKYSKDAIESAIQIAKKIDAELSILHVIEEEKPFGINTTADISISQSAQKEHNRYIIELMKKKQHDLNDFLKSYEADHIKIKTFIEVGDYVDRLKTIASENNIDLIIIGTSGETSVTELYKGNHAEQTTRNLSVPVLSVKQYQNFDAVKTIGFLVNLENPNKRLISLINNLNKIMKLELVILHKKELEFVENSELIVHLRLLAREYSMNPKAIFIMDGEGNFSEELQNAVDKYQVDIIAKTVEQKSAFARLFFEDHTRELINDFNESALLMSK